MRALRFPRLHCAYAHEFLLFRAVGGHASFSDVVDPAVKFQIPLFQTHCHGWMRLQIAELLDHVALRKLQQKFGIARMDHTGSVGGR